MATRETGTPSDALVERVLRDGGRGFHTRVAGLVTGGRRTVVLASPAAAEPPDTPVLFEIGSVTKVFTATLLAEMHLRGEVDLSDPVSRHLPAGDLPAWRERVPTLEELATHRGALPNTPRPLALKEGLTALGALAGDPWEGISEERYREMLKAMRPRRAPGGRVRYSSMGFGLLGDALSHRAGVPFDDLVQQRVCGPLGLSHTAIDAGESARTRLVAGRSRKGAARPPLRDHMPAAGALTSSAEDLLTFLEACLAPSGEPVGRALALAQRPRVRMNKRLSVGLGWLVLSRPRRPPVLWHSGGTWGYRSFAAFLPAERRAAVVLSNTTAPVDRIGFKLIG